MKRPVFGSRMGIVFLTAGFLVDIFLTTGFFAGFFLPVILPFMGMDMAALVGVGLGEAAWAIPNGAKAAKRTATRSLRMVIRAGLFIPTSKDYARHGTSWVGKRPD